MARSLLKLKNYEVHSITTVHGDKMNANIATWVMQSGMKASYLSVALYKIDFTIKLVRASKVLNVNLLAQDQKNLIAKLGRKSGREADKFRRLPFALDARGCPYLTDSIGYVCCEVHDVADSGDHEVFCCRILGQSVLHPEKAVLTHHWLKEHGLVRG
jgi:flavin reductase (DIM6/NTAB) family NADH-FMN oxidoreductase RutF